MWAIIVIMCVVQDGKPQSCTADTGTKVFETKEECESYAKFNYQPIPECLQPFTVYDATKDKV